MSLYYWKLDEQDECFHYAVFAENEDQAWDELLKLLVASDYGWPEWPYKEFEDVKNGKRYVMTVHPVKLGGFAI